MSRPIVIFMINMIKNIIKIWFLTCLLIASSDTERSNNIATAIDVSVYNGEGSILLNWSFPDSIKVKNTIIYGQKFGDEQYKELAMLPPDIYYFLDTNCEPGSRYFYKVLVKDIYNNLYHSTASELPFGSCDIIENPSLFDKNIKSVNDLLNKYVKEQLYPNIPNDSFNKLLEKLFEEEVHDYKWIENFTPHLLKSYAQIIDKTNEIILNQNLYLGLMSYEKLYRNQFLLNPEMWKNQIEKAVSLVRVNWRILYDGYPNAIAMLNKLDPIRIVASENFQLKNPKITLTIFHLDQLKSKEWYLLSGNEYINLEKFLRTDIGTIVVDVPQYWHNVSLMMEGLIVQTVPILIEKSILYTLEGDIIPNTGDSPNLIKIKKEKSHIWLNELNWDFKSKIFHVEIAGIKQLGEKYLIRDQEKIIWSIDLRNSFEEQYLDSVFSLGENFDFPLTLEFEMVNDSLQKSFEYIVLDTVSKFIARVNNNGPWVSTISNTLGSTNTINQNEYDSELVPQLFVLYQNYPNPFNGQTRITFDLLEDAMVTLYVTDATGRVKDKILEEEFFNSGIYNYLWEGENLSSGIYFITLQAEVNNIQPVVFSRKMIYLK